MRACREVQVNDVIGMGLRGSHAVPVFDIHDPMGLSTCVTCGECVQACPTGALYEKSLMDKPATKRAVQKFDKVVATLCPFCGVGCQTSVAVKDNRIVQVDGRNGYANENRLCVKGRFGFDYVASPERLTKPLIRRDDAPRNVRLHAAVRRPLERVPRSHLGRGADACGEAGSRKSSTSAAARRCPASARRRARTRRPISSRSSCARASRPTTSITARGCATRRPLRRSWKAWAPAPCRRRSTPSMDSDCIVVIGARPTVNHPVAATFFKQAAKRGAKLIVIDPRGQDLMRHATHALKFNAGSDVALLNSLLHTIIEEKLYDEEYIRANVSGFEALKAKVKDFSPEAMAEVVGVEASVLRDVARIYATSKASIIFWGMGISQHTHGTDNARCLIALALITGQIGRPGTGLHPLRGQNNVQGASDAGLIPMYFPDYKSVEKLDIRGWYENFWGQTLDPKRGLTVVEIMDAVHEGEITGMYIMGENPAMSDPIKTHARDALAMLEHLVVQDIFLTETAWFADVVLPASAHAEKLGTFTNTNRQVQMGRPGARFAR